VSFAATSKTRALPGRARFQTCSAASNAVIHFERLVARLEAAPFQNFGGTIEKLDEYLAAG
jgi:hypothetical protein